MIHQCPRQTNKTKPVFSSTYIYQECLCENVSLLILMSSLLDAVYVKHIASERTFGKKECKLDSRMCEYNSSLSILLAGVSDDSSGTRDGSQRRWKRNRIQWDKISSNSTFKNWENTQITSGYKFKKNSSTHRCYDYNSHIIPITTLSRNFQDSKVSSAE